MKTILYMSAAWAAISALVLAFLSLATRATRRDLGTLPANWQPNRGDLRRHNREMREIRGV